MLLCLPVNSAQSYLEVHDLRVGDGYAGRADIESTSFCDAAGMVSARRQAEEVQYEGRRLAWRGPADDGTALRDTDGF